MNGIIKLPEWNRPGVPGPSPMVRQDTGGQQALMRANSDNARLFQGAMGLAGDVLTQMEKTRMQVENAELSAALTQYDAMATQDAEKIKANPNQNRDEATPSEEGQRTGSGITPFYYANVNPWDKMSKDRHDTISEGMKSPGAKQRFSEAIKMRAPVDRKAIEMFDEGLTKKLIAETTIKSIATSVDNNNYQNAQHVIQLAVEAGTIDKSKGEELAKAAALQIAQEWIKEIKILTLPSGEEYRVGDSVRSEMLKNAEDAHKAVAKQTKEYVEALNVERRSSATSLMDDGKIKTHADIDAHLDAGGHAVTGETRLFSHNYLDNVIDGRRGKNTSEQEAMKAVVYRWARSNMSQEQFVKEVQLLADGKHQNYPGMSPNPLEVPGFINMNRKNLEDGIFDNTLESMLAPLKKSLEDERKNRLAIDRIKNAFEKSISKKEMDFRAGGENAVSDAGTRAKWASEARKEVEELLKTKPATLAATGDAIQGMGFLNRYKDMTNNPETLELRNGLMGVMVELMRQYDPAVKIQPGITTDGAVKSIDGKYRMIPNKNSTRLVIEEFKYGVTDLPGGSWIVVFPRPSQPMTAKEWEDYKKAQEYMRATLGLPEPAALPEPEALPETRADIDYPGQF
jgi:hypothetical protein